MKSTIVIVWEKIAVFILTSVVNSPIRRLSLFFVCPLFKYLLKLYISEPSLEQILIDCRLKKEPFLYIVSSFLCLKIIDFWSKYHVIFKRLHDSILQTGTISLLLKKHCRFTLWRVVLVFFLIIFYYFLPLTIY